MGADHNIQLMVLSHLKHLTYCAVHMVTDLAPAKLKRKVAEPFPASDGWGVVEGPLSMDPQPLSPEAWEQSWAHHLVASADAGRSPRQCAHALHTTCLVSEHKHVNSENTNSYDRQTLR